MRDQEFEGSGILSTQEGSDMAKIWLHLTYYYYSIIDGTNQTHMNMLYIIYFNATPACNKTLNNEPESGFSITMMSFSSLTFTAGSACSTGRSPSSKTAKTWESDQNFKKSTNVQK